MSKHKKSTTSYPQYLVVECTALDGQWECEYDRNIKFVTTDKNEAFKKKDYQFEVYGINENGLCIIIKEVE